MTIETCLICGSDLMDLMICTYPPIPVKQCNNCGWRWEGEREEITRRSFSLDKYKDELIRKAIESGDHVIFGK